MLPAVAELSTAGQEEAVVFVDLPAFRFRFLLGTRPSFSYLGAPECVACDNMIVYRTETPTEATEANFLAQKSS